MEIEAIKKIIESYKNDRIREYLKNSETRGVCNDVACTIEQSINRIIHNALEGISGEKQNKFKYVDESDTFVFPDIHGRLDLFVQNLYVGGLIDKEGNWVAKDKTCILLGDLINRGPYSPETLIYSRAIQEQAREDGSRFEILIGNHEDCLLNKWSLDFYNFKDIEIVREIVKENIESKNSKLLYADNDKNILCSHAGINKDILKKFLKAKRIDLSDEEKINSKKLFEIMNKNKLSVEDLAEFLNSETTNKESTFAMMYVNKENKLISEILNSRKKVRNQDIRDLQDKEYKVVQFVGHTTTSVERHFKNARSFGAIKKINNWFFLDYDLLRGYQAFVAIKNDRVYQIYNKENGLSCISEDRELQYRSKVPEKFWGQPLCFCNNIKKLKMENWSVEQIAKLPMKNTDKKIEFSILKRSASRNNGSKQDLTI